MEAVRPKKPKTKPQNPQSAVQNPSPSIVNGFVLPAAPSHEIRDIPRPISPEPEEIADSSLTPEVEPPEIEYSQPRPSVPQAQPAEVAAPPIDTSKLIFPKIAEPLTDSSNNTRTEISLERTKAAMAYPSVPELTSIADYMPPVPATRMKPPDYAAAMADVKENAPPMYPAVSSIVFEKTEHGLLSEQQLLFYYENKIYETAEDYVDKFIQNEEIPSGPLFYLLKRLRELGDGISSAEVNEKSNTEILSKCLREAWTQYSQTMDFKGRCGENKEGSGQAKFNTAQYSVEKANELRSLLSTNRHLLLDQRLCNESQFRSVALQIQWQICTINNQFMAEHGLTANNSPFLVENVLLTAGRSLLLTSLSDLFYYLRAPNIPKRFYDAVTGWIRELVCFLNMSCRVVDAQFVLNHLLRLPSPIAGWAAQLVQTFVQCPTNSKLKIDYCLTMMSHLMNPIKGRDVFLGQIRQSEKEDQTWTILSDDDDQGEFSFVTINEADLTAMLDQLPVSEIYSVAYLHCSAAFDDKSSQFLSTLAFQLLLMKVLNDGLSTYARPGYKQFCKQIGNSIRQSVRELCSHWRVTKDIVSGSDAEQIQKEVDRVLLLALQYLITSPGMSENKAFAPGLWQFLVDLPYDCVSEECRLRCEFMLRTTDKHSLPEIYSLSRTELQSKIKSSVLKDRVETINVDSVFLVNALSTLVSYSHNDPSTFLKELIDVCYCDSSSRESLYKVGAEGIATLLTRRPLLLDSLISILDRNIDHMDNYAVDVVASTTLSSCKINPAVMGIIGKWLINHAPNEAANRLARRILSGLHWGYADDQASLWIEQKVHEICADSVVKAHAKHCGSSNGMISKSISKITKMASKVADHEQIFAQFCWDILIKLKLQGKTGPVDKPQNDLAAFYVSLVESQIHSPQLFVSQGVPLLSELISSGSSIASIVILSKVMVSHHDQITLISSSKTFLDVFERIIHVDALPYAVQWLTGPSSTPTPITRFICCSISYYAPRVTDLMSYLRAWVDILCVKRAALWNTDQASLQILGTITRIAFLQDSKGLLGLKETINNLYTQMLALWRDSNKGIFSIFSSDSSPPPLISSTYYNVSPWTTYLLLLVESNAYPTFYQAVWENLAKKDKNTLGDAVKKASSKVSMNIPLSSLAPYCWANFVNNCKDTVVYPLAVQQLATEVYKLRIVNGQKFQFARRIVDCKVTEALMVECRKSLTESSEGKGLSKAVASWLFTNKEVTMKQFDFSQFDLDYLLQFILSNEETIWLDYVNIDALTKEEDQDARLFIATCHLGTRERRALPNSHSTRFISSRALPFLVLPSHQGLPTAPKVDTNILFNYNEIKNMSAVIIDGIHAIAEEYLVGSEKIATEDIGYCELLPKLYGLVSRNIPLTIRCSSKCPSPVNTQGAITAMEFNNMTDGQMTQNREKRSKLWAELFSSIADRTAVHTAGLEHIARQLARWAALCNLHNRVLAQNSGRSFFYQLTSLSKDSVLLFPCSAAAYSNALRTLGQEFVLNRPEEQISVMRLVLDGFVFSEPLIEAFSPECLSSTELCEAYSRLSDAVRDSERSPRALRLLARLGIDKAATSLPPHQFAPLLPLAFKNLAAQPDGSTPLHQICLQHVVSFVFHAFPANFPAGLDLALSGCDNGETPVHLLDIIVSKLGAEQFTNSKGEYSLPPAKCSECAITTARRLSDARSRLPSFYACWAKYLPATTRLAQLFLYLPAAAGFAPDSPMSVLQRDLLELFGRVSAVFSPLLAVQTPSVPPFSLSHETEAKLVVDRFVELLAAMPQSQSVPPGMQNLLSLVWQYYYEKLSTLQHGTVHYFATLESGLIKLPWTSFYPSLRGIQAMDECLLARSKDCASFITQMVVRVPWKQVLQSHIPEEQKPSYLYYFASILARIVSYPGCYTKVSASFLDLLKNMSQRQDWDTVPPEQCENLSKTIGGLMPGDCLTSPTEAIAVYQIIWRKICCFSPNWPFTSISLFKQTVWLRTECQLLLKGNVNEAKVAYNSVVSDVHKMASNHENPRAFVVVTRELTVLWTSITDKKFGEIVVNAWNSFLESNPDSPLVLLSLNTILASLNQDQVTTALKVMDRTIKSYFKRAGAKWEEVMAWIQFPTGLMRPVQDYLLSLPSSSTNVQPLHLVLKAFLDYGSHEDYVFSSLHAYITNVKPKHIACEASFALIIQRYVLFLSQKAKSLPSTFAATEDNLLMLRTWMQKAAKDESNLFSNMFSSKKAYSPKFRTLLTIVEAYLQQQSLGDGKRPRCEGDTPVLNARIATIKDLAGAKPFSQFPAPFNLSTAYFTQVDLHHLGSAPQLMLRAAQALFNERFLTDE